MEDDIIEEDDDDHDHDDDDNEDGGKVTVRRRRRLRVEVREGDLLLLDTSAWWHETALPPSGGGGGALSVSYAREFFLHDEHGGETGQVTQVQSHHTHSRPPSLENTVSKAPSHASHQPMSDRTHPPTSIVCVRVHMPQLHSQAFRESSATFG